MQGFRLYFLGILSGGAAIACVIGFWLQKKKVWAVYRDFVMNYLLTSVSCIAFFLTWVLVSRRAHPGSGDSSFYFLVVEDSDADVGND